MIFNDEGGNGEGACYTTVALGGIWQGKTKAFPKEGQIFQGGAILIFIPENVKYQKLLCVECYLAVNCPNPTPAPFWHFWSLGRPLFQGIEPLNPLH